MNKIIKLILLLLPLLYLGCAKDAEISLPEYKPTLVIHSYISPLDTGVVVFVNMSKSAYNNSYSDMKNVTNATVTISDSVTTATLAFIPATMQYGFSCYYVDSTLFKITAGKNYTLTVSSPDGKLATASTTIPGIVPVSTLSYEKKSSQFGDSVYQIKFTFNDPFGTDDYYKFGAHILNIDSTNGTLNPYSSEQYGTYFSADGNLISEQMEAYQSDSHSQFDTRWLDFRIMHVTKEYYLYHLSIENFGGGPFSEPSVAFTNITGGVGVFAGYNYDQKLYLLQ